MVEVTTNRDLYLAVLQLIEQHRENTRALDEYLRALWGAALQYRERLSLTPNEFLGVLAAGFSEEPFPFEAELWLENHGDISALGLENAPGYPGWEFCVARQLIDLLEMAANEQLANEQRFFGIDAPCGERWYNFTPGDFLVCAAQYLFVDGVDDESSPIGAISWEQFRDFLGAGQAYE